MRYTENEISYFDSDLAKIRAKPGMYVGSVDEDGVLKLVTECTDNALDEAAAGRNSSVEVWVDDARTSFVIADRGVGIPVKKHPKANISTLTHVLTALQSSGKMRSGEAYKNAIGTHGVGLKGVNALSTEMTVTTYRKDAGGWFTTTFREGKEKKKVSKCQAPVLPDGTKARLGTIVSFTVDPKIFGKHKLLLDRLSDWARMASYLNPKVDIALHHRGKHRNYRSERGMFDYIDWKLKNLSLDAVGKPLILRTDALDIAIAFTGSPDCHMNYYTNTVINRDGGFHADYMLKALMASLKPYAPKKAKFTLGALKAGMVGMLNIRMDAPSFSSQTKDKLVDERAKQPCYDECLKMFTEAFAKNKTFAKQICQRAAEFAAATIDFRNNAKAMRELKKRPSKGLLPGKLAQAIGCSDDKRELFVVEGDSAGGTAKVARDRSFQEILSLKGKIVNAERKKQDEVLSSEEVLNILKAIGFDPSKPDPTKHLRVGRVLILSDADVDGRHIDALLITLLYKYLPKLFEDGRVFIVKSYEFVARVNDKSVFADSLEKMKARCGGKLPKQVTQLKGLGEMGEEDLRQMAFNPATRKLWQIKLPDAAGNKLFKQVMGESVEYRRQMLGIM